MRNRVPARLKRLAKRLLSPVPARLSRNFIRLDRDAMEALRASILANYLTGWRSESNYPPEYYAYLVADHLHTGLDGDRHSVIPWLDSVRRLQGLRVLDIGCGTGSSSVALAEQGASVTAIDIDEGALQVAKDRCRLHGLEVELLHMNAEAVARFGANAFDLVSFSGSLEHMTSAERLPALKGAWDILPPGGQLVVVDSPNRLWYFDAHTSKLPFYNWLPNDLAFRYSRFSPRENFRELYLERDPSREEHFLRRGRGVSFHEFDLALKPAGELRVASTLNSYAPFILRFLRSDTRHAYKSMLMSICPGIHEGFFDPTLDLVIQRD